MTCCTGADIPSMPTPLMMRYLIMAFTSLSSILPGRILISMALPMPQGCHRFKGIGMWGSTGIMTTSSFKDNLNSTMLPYRGLSRQLSRVSMLANGQHLMLLCRHTKTLISSSNYSSSMAQVGQARPLCTCSYLQGMLRRAHCSLCCQLWNCIHPSSEWLHCSFNVQDTNPMHRRFILHCQ